ncbi:hypothetical protein KQI88_04735 [Alkaliphilus sp. MSJ-5]|uniref:Uncharacterized protein n=1 Tax=Alkaliphilus flagellatus TaxID=2841507 RepID=A0ABS6FZP4_9FIRM|nr:hypothetical protein [Alkaliphilus flagellatus]MBU5675715.1 hypothetical protein [Alkaliphilus flagellatus]
MGIKNYKKKCITLGISLIITGTIITIVGFGLTGFDLSKFKGTDSYKWYRTINIGHNFY